MKNETIETIETIAKKFSELEEVEKDFISGVIIGLKKSTEIKATKAEEANAVSEKIGG